MKRGLGAQGYTLIEVMIVLAISGGLLAAAMFLIAGQRQRTEFSQAIREIDSQIQEVINNVGTGYYANTGNFICDGTTGRPRLQTATGDTQGTNKDCIFIGRVLQFGVNGSNGEAYNVINVVGLKQYLSGATYKQSQSFAEAKPTAMAPGDGASADFPDATDRRKLGYGLSIASIKVGNQSVGAVGFFGSLAPYGATNGNLVSGAQSVDLVPIPNTALNASQTSVVNAINAMDTASVTKNPSGGVTLCFQSGGTNQYGQIAIGNNGRQLTTTLTIQSGTCP